jgi:hypothetical protein
MRKAEATPMPHSSAGYYVSGRYCVNGLGQAVVAFGHGIACIVGAQAEFYYVVFVAEPRVMVEALSLGRNFGEEGKRRFKVSKAEAAAQAIVGFGPHRW